MTSLCYHLGNQDGIAITVGDKPFLRVKKKLMCCTVPEEVVGATVVVVRVARSSVNIAVIINVSINNSSSSIVCYS